MSEMKIRLRFTEEVLGTASANPDVHKEYVASKAPDAKSMEEEVEAIGKDEVFEKGMTVFPRMDDGTPCVWDYQIKGMMKDACGMLRKVAGTKSSKCKAYKKEIDGLIFIKERKIPFVNEDITICQRPLRAASAQGERVALASSEAIQAGASIEFTVICMVDEDMDMVREWLDYGRFRGFGQWRNSGKGRYTWEELASDDGENESLAVSDGEKAVNLSA